MAPPGWQKPITAQPGQMQHGVDPLRLLPSRVDLLRSGLDRQRALHLRSRSRVKALSGMDITPFRSAAEEGRTVDVRVIPWLVPAVGPSIMALPVG